MALKFHFTPADTPRGDETNPHAKATTEVADTVQALREAFGPAVQDHLTYAGEHTVYIAAEQIVAVCRYLKEDLGYSYLVDLGGVDRFVEDGRFEVYYNLVNVADRQRIRLKVRVEEDAATVPSVTGIFKAADWNERECFDMLGITFAGHPDLRRMYMPEDFAYYPQRKEFPLLGIPGSLPLPPQTPEGSLTMDPYAAAHGQKPVKSYEEPRSSK